MLGIDWVTRAKSLVCEREQEIPANYSFESNHARFTVRPETLNGHHRLQ